jgi:predicted transport protein
MLKRNVDTKLKFNSAQPMKHIIRTIEYWDIERKRYPQYEHCAVLVAEDITSRFLNVVSLFNGTIPLIALQMSALRFGDNISVIFTKVMDELVRGVVDEDEDAEATPTNREYWEKRGSKATVHLADEVLSVAKEFDPSLELKYNKFYIGLLKDSQAYNFLSMRPRKSTLNLALKIPRSDEIDDIIEKSGLETLEYSARWALYRLSLQKQDIAKKRDSIKQLIGLAYQNRAA